MVDNVFQLFEWFLVGDCRVIELENTWESVFSVIIGVDWLAICKAMFDFKALSWFRYLGLTDLMGIMFSSKGICCHFWSDTCPFKFFRASYFHSAWISSLWLLRRWSNSFCRFHSLILFEVFGWLTWCLSFLSLLGAMRRKRTKIAQYFRESERRDRGCDPL